MEQAGIINGRIAKIDPAKVGLPVAAFVAVETADHSAGWLQRFAEVVRDTPEIVDAWRMSGDVDYLLHVVVPDIAAYDAFYRKLIGAVKLRNVSSRFSMERLKAAPPSAICSRSSPKRRPPPRCKPPGMPASATTTPRPGTA